ncbi:DUF2213 domain-containing protein [Desulfatitalea tepidiphila]|uniref:DUF2213 domain-containing protein n=1 Tax=Desulfatitalea tepidiphila TaxID=1185843 RepID=UPI000977882C|nr:DUF2213 domain-containing protein [Desulfatitalea tepidiphila]
MLRILNFAASSPDRPKWTKTAEGWLRCRARILAERVMPYTADELVGALPPNFPTDEILMAVTRQAMTDPDALRSLEGVPLVGGDHHWLDENNVKQFAIGAVAGTPKLDGDYLVCDLLVTFPEAIRAIEAGELGEISAAYVAETTYEPGILNGQRFDAIQQQLRFNHLAIIPPGYGRAGEDVRIFNLKGVRPMNSEAFENGRNKALSEIQAKLDAAKRKKLSNYDFDQEEADELALANITNSDPQATLRRIMNQRRTNRFGTPHFTPADVRRMMNARDREDASFADVRAMNRTIALAKMGVMNAGEALESIEELRAKAGLRKIRRSKVGNLPTAAEALEVGYKKYKNRRDPLEKMGFKGRKED